MLKGEKRIWTCDSKFDFATHIPQWKFEKILTDHLNELGVVIEHAHHLVHIDIIDLDNDTPIHATVCNLQSGVEKTIFSKYLFGIDGGKSFVRKSLGIPVEGMGV